MFWPSFINAALLTGLVAVAIPILIHLMLKTRQRRMKFSTLRFFDFLNEEAVRSRKLRHWLLLLLRLLIIILLVLAFARPFLSNTPASAMQQQPQWVIFILDRSLSMTARETEGVRWERARAAIRKILYNLPRDARVGLIACGGQSEWIAQPGPATEALKALDALQPLQAAGDLGDALLLAGRFFIQHPIRSTNTLYIVSDFQRSSTLKVPDVPLPPYVYVEWVSVGDAHSPNCAVTDVNLAAISGQTSAVIVANFDTDDTTPFPVQFLVDGKVTTSRTLSLPAAALTNLDFNLPRLSPGWHSVAVRLENSDSLATDNTRYQALYIPPPLPVLLVEPRQTVKIYQEETFFLRAALDPYFGQTNSGLTGFEVDTTTPDELVRRLDAGTRYGPYSLPIIPAIKRWPPGASAKLTTFVQNGGGLLLFAGDNLSINHYTTELGNLLPGRWNTIESATDMDWRIIEWEKRSPIFAPFLQPNAGSPAVARFTKRLSVQPLEADQVLARFQDGHPAMILRNVDRGRVLFVNASADTQWHDWPRHKTFVPWLHCTARFLAGRNLDLEGTRPPPALAGSEIEIVLDKNMRNLPLKWMRPDGIEQTLTTDSAGIAHALPMPVAGLYSLRDSQGRELRRIAANLPPSESDLTAFTPMDMQNRLTRRDTPSTLSAASLWLNDENGHKELWRLLLLAGLLLMLTETIVGNRTVP